MVDGGAAGAARHLGAAIAGVINLYDPERVILAGSAISESRGMFVGRVRDTALANIYPGGDRSVAILPAALGDRAPVMGAAALVYDHLFRVGGIV